MTIADGRKLMNRSRVKVVIIGFGNRARKYLRYLISKPESALVAAVVERDPVRLREAVLEFSLPYGILFSSFDDFIASGIQADAAIVATNDDSHYQLALKALGLRMSVLLEKPMAETEQECRQLVAASSNVTAGLCYILRYHPYFRRIAELSATESLGRLKSVHHKVVVGIERMTHTFVRGLWSRAKESSPVFVSKCCHDVDWLLHLTGCKSVSDVELKSAESSLSLYCVGAAPEQAALRCIDCPLKDGCRYSAVDLYLKRGEWTDNFIPLQGESKTEAIERELREGDFGRCVFHCDNDVEDYSKVEYRIKGGVDVVMEMDGITDGDGRESVLEFEKGRIEAKANCIRMIGPEGGELFEDWNEVCSLPSHAGADEELIDDFLGSVISGRKMLCSFEDAYISSVTCLITANYLSNQNT